MTDKTGGPAFPSEDTCNFYSGMTLRDYYMGQVVPAVVTVLGDKFVFTSDIIENAAHIVDAMIAERSK